MRKWSNPLDGIEELKTREDRAKAGILTGLVLLLALMYTMALQRRVERQKQHLHPIGTVKDQRPLNHLAGSVSPYLLEHAHNPVDWYPWGEAALQRAKSENRPIFLSVGYSACHWCHVMERDDFENPAIARIMNANFVCIKVDREERPDIDDQYQIAVQIITGSGGWPMSVWLTPDLKPFHAGTYIPPNDFESQLNLIASIWLKNRSQIQTNADIVCKRMQQAARLSGASSRHNPLPSDISARATHSLLEEWDRKHGGFGDRPKFPEVPKLLFLLDEFKLHSDPEVGKLLASTLEAMYRGGIFDQLAGGFHRYSTDEKWLIPHFEKMLYDQALLADLYLIAGQMMHRSDFIEVGRRTLDFVLSDMTDSATGSFYTSIDADSDGEEGKYYLWTRNQVYDCLDKNTANLVCDVYGVGPNGNFQDEMSVLHITRQPKADEQKLLDSARKPMLQSRQARLKPTVDDKVLMGINGLMIEALVHGFEATGEKRYLDAATRVAAYITRVAIDGKGELQHELHSGQPGKVGGFLQDYSYMSRGLLSLHVATRDDRWLDKASAMIGQMVHRFLDKSPGSAFMASGPEGGPVATTTSSEDTELPASGGVAALDLVDLARQQGERSTAFAGKASGLLQLAKQSVTAYSTNIIRSPAAYPTLILAYDRAMLATVHGSETGVH